MKAESIEMKERMKYKKLLRKYNLSNLVKDEYNMQEILHWEKRITHEKEETKKKTDDVI